MTADTKNHRWIAYIRKQTVRMSLATVPEIPSTRSDSKTREPTIQYLAITRRSVDLLVSRKPQRGSIASWVCFKHCRGCRRGISHGGLRSPRSQSTGLCIMCDIKRNPSSWHRASQCMVCMDCGDYYSSDDSHVGKCQLCAVSDDDNGNRPSKSGPFRAASSRDTVISSP